MPGVDTSAVLPDVLICASSTEKLDSGAPLAGIGGDVDALDLDLGSSLHAETHEALPVVHLAVADVGGSCGVHTWRHRIQLLEAAANRQNRDLIFRKIRGRGRLRKINHGAFTADRH